MPASLRILKPHGLVFVDYEGIATLQDTMQVFGEYLSHPDFHPGQKHLVDMSKVDDWEGTYVDLMSSQAHKASAFVGQGAQTLIVYYVPTEIARTIGQLVVNSWEPFPSVVPILVDTEETALSTLGIDFTTFAELLASCERKT
ncbi:hypothetical protein BXY66_1265 [Shimia isoporae]|uniref:Uncharacterized protein n=1 Tax=Shimia isoporae TaxID=647720 RepID=A0A4V2Q406_9RHOB|nr:hypothetical protein [Shimia isoporae]TCL09220.1 hypothetical protein BXY66_1265 [Shimia isoporae]